MSSGNENKAYFLWQHEHGSKWITYPADKLEAINKAFNKSQKTVTLPDSSASKQIIVNFENMVQKNKTTGWEQRIRCCLYDGSGFFVWQWKDDDKYWYCYEPKIALELENAAKHNKEKLNLYFNGADYEISFKDMTQKNEETNNVRAIKRSKVVISKAEQSLLHVVALCKTATCDNDAFVDSATDATNGDGKTGVSRSKKRKIATPEMQKSESCVKTVILKGKAPVDPECTEMLGKAHVYFEGGDVYDAMLNQTNLQFNNNKFYIIQLLEDDTSKAYYVWYRWGRVGKRGQSNLMKFGTNLSGAVQDFEKKFYDKTRNNWDEREYFEKVVGKYDLLKMDYNPEEPKKEKPSVAKAEPSKAPKSNLHPKVMSLIELICNIKLMEETVMEMKYDAKKAPLGKLTVAQIKAGYIALKKIEDVLNSNDKGSALIQACNEFYTRIPHDFGMKTPPLIQTTLQIREKMQMLEALGDIEIAIKILNDEYGKNEHPADSHYNSLNCKLTTLDKNSSSFKMIQKYMMNTHAQTHSNYKIEIIDIFECTKQGEKEKFEDVGNRMLLWHGSRLTNWVGILKQGLRIAPPEAPSTGYMFGKGLYFADMSSKSANYCYATRTKNEGLISLCEVSVGVSNKLVDADCQAHKLPKGKHSVMGLGRVAPDPKEVVVMDDGTKVPLGKPVDASLKTNESYTLNYNEYIVYNVNQVRMRYIVRMKFIFL